jgi:hypothetical protein
MTLEDLKNAVAGLSNEQLARFRAWFSNFDSAAWDRQLEEDVAAGRLDALADEAIQEHQSGKTSEL